MTNKKKTGEATQTVGDQLLARLFTEPSLLRERGLSEQSLAQLLGVPKSAMREEIIVQESRDQLVRGANGGILRPELKTDGVIEGHAFWMMLEKSAAATIAASSGRLSAAADIGAVVTRQKRAFEARDVAGWVKADIDIHKAVMTAAGAKHNKRALDRTITRLRIGSGLIESDEQQKAVMELNDKLVRMLSHGSKDDVARAIEDRVKFSLRASLEALGITYDEQLWAMTKDLIPVGKGRG